MIETKSPRRHRVRSLLLAAAKARATQALTLSNQSTPLFAPYSPSPLSVIDAVWTFLHDAGVSLQPHELLVDLGCGDARWLISGVERWGCRALGIEIDPQLVQTARSNVERLAPSVSERIQIVEADILRHSIAGAKIVIVYAFAESLSGIREYLESQLGSDAMVLSIGFRVPGWKPTWSDRVDALRWYVYDMQHGSVTTRDVVGVK
ncbi:hypothetical protein PINS_up022409 [Pythium insidiosum]|nr:hypothetical protein PINS_up005936 [Pythium insidiosum]GLE10308.1 hypothetical protein PINS_up022409 [Pythium insidiosum]